MSKENQIQGTVVAAYRKYTLVSDQNDNLYQCQQRKSIGQIVCGDIVHLIPENEETAVITAIEDRHTILQRPDINGKLRIIASNIDQIYIVVAHKPEMNEGLIDRYLVAAEHSHLQPVIVFNKIDLIEEELFAALDNRLQLYKDIGYSVIHTSAKQEHGLEKLIESLNNKNNIFVGQSGVGKSSLINTILKDSNARIGEISESTGKGKHTTTTAYLYPLKQNKGHIIDSPGVREFGLTKMSNQEVAEGFAEFRPYLGYCKFRNCAHNNEPGCSLLEAVSNHKISEQRWKSYQRIIASINES